LDLIWEGIKKAIELLWSLDREVLGITWLTLKISGLATLISLVLGVCAGMGLALTAFPGRRFVIALINSSMGLPPVVVGLWVTMFLWRNGPLGFLELLYTPSAIVIAQIIIATPIIAALSLTAIQRLPQNLKLQILSLGATRLQMLWMLAKEAKLPLMAAIMAGFGGVVSEVGASIMVGGNLRGYTRVLTTATVMETGRGNFDIALALGFILLLLSFAVNALLTHLQQRERPR
jgi:tungstate transport system permease protein